MPETVKKTAPAPRSPLARLIGARRDDGLEALAEAMRAVREAPEALPLIDVPEGGQAAALASDFAEMLAAIRDRHETLERALADRTAELERAQKSADELRRQSGEILHGLRRELQGPLGGVGALAGWLGAADLPPPARRYAQLIAGAGASLITLVDDVLAETPELDFQPVDPATAVEDVLGLFWAKAKAKGVDLAAFVDPAIPEKIEADPARLRQAIGALVGGALDRTREGAVIVRVAGKDEGLGISVHDTGEPLTRELAGLGLVQGRRFAEAMGGRLAARGADKGSVATLSLPAAVRAPTIAWPSLEGEIAEIAVASAATRATLQRYLAAAGMTVVEDGAETSSENPPGLVIAEASALKGAPRRAGQVICLAEPGETAPRLLHEAGLADLVLERPVRRRPLAQALAQLAAGAPLSETGDAPILAKPQPKPATATVGPTTAADLLDPQVTGELARLVAAGKSDFVARVRRLYRENAPEAVKAIIEASTNRDCDAAAKAAHALKSMSLNMGARVVAETAGRLEAQARELQVVNVDQAQILHRQLLATLDVLEGYPPDLRPNAAGGGAAPDEEALLDDLTLAIERDELALVYQPQFDREGETITGIETLVRWNHATRGFVSPAFFIPIAERYGLIGRITHWVLARAMAETRELGDFTISFNASAVEFADPSFVDELAVLIARCGFDPRRLEIEVTETAVLAEEDEVRRNMARLHELGLKIALDDFGVGYSSLSHLRLFPFDKLKIDRAFVTGCAENVQSATLVHAVVSIGRALGMKVVAEGVETEAQRKFLKVAGVHAMQGYLFAKPEPVEALRARLDAMRAPAALSA